MSVASRLDQLENQTLDWRFLLRATSASRRRTTALVRVSGAGLCDGWACVGAGARKPPKEETAGRLWGPFGERVYGDLRIADGWRARRRQSATLGVFSGSADGWGFRWRRCAGARRWPRSQEDLRPRAGVALVFRRAAGGGGDRRCAAGCGARRLSLRCRPRPTATSTSNRSAIGCWGAGSIYCARRPGNRRRDFSVRLTGAGLDDGPRSARFHLRSANLICNELKQRPDHCRTDRLGELLRPD